MRKTVKVRTWGQAAIGDFTVRYLEGEKAEAVARSIARRTRLSVVTFRHDGTAIDKGVATAHHYQITLGRPCQKGGWTVEGELWCAVPVLK